MRQEFKTATERAYDRISADILNGTLAPGTRLSRRQMAAMTGVSVIPVTEAVRLLERDGLVESRAHYGTRVVALTEEKARDLYALREAVECQVARMLAGRATPVQLEQLRALARQVDAVRTSPETDREVWALHHQFHITMAEFSGCPSLKDALQRVNLYRLLQNAVSRRMSRWPQLPPDWHMRVIDAIASGNPDQAEVMMREHVQDSLKR